MELRNSKVNANTLVEIPAFLSMLPNIKGKKVLDLGCGFGDHCQEYRRLGAKQVVGIDISLNMITEANRINKDENITFINMAMEDINRLDMGFDIITSSLAFQYIEDFKTLIYNIYHLLNDYGYLVFSQEHPLTSAYHNGNGPRWEKDEDGNKIASRLFDYGIEGEKLTHWYDTNVIKYHRTFATILNTLIEVGFIIDKVLEPIPSEEVIAKYPEFSDNIHRPDFLIIRAIKHKGAINE